MATAAAMPRPPAKNWRLVGVRRPLWLALPTGDFAGGQPFLVCLARNPDPRRGPVDNPPTQEHHPAQLCGGPSPPIASHASTIRGTGSGLESRKVADPC